MCAEGADSTLAGIGASGFVEQKRSSVVIVARLKGSRSILTLLSHSGRAPERLALHLTLLSHSGRAPEGLALHPDLAIAQRPFADSVPLNVCRKNGRLSDLKGEHSIVRFSDHRGGGRVGDL